jgi:hypothetical protein
MNLPHPDKITDAELPAALAEMMGWETKQFGPEWAYMNRDASIVFEINEWSPLTDRNHCHLAVEKCAELGLMHFEDSAFQGDNSQSFEQNFTDNLLIELQESIDIEWTYRQVSVLLLATPVQISRAVYRTLFEHAEHRQKDSK